MRDPCDGTLLYLDCCSVAQLSDSETSWTVAHQTSMSYTLPELAQTHVHWVSDAIQPSSPLLSPSPLAVKLSQPQSLFQWVSSSHQGAKYWSFRSASVPAMKIQDWFPLGLTGLISLQPRGLYSTVVTSQIYHDKITELSPPLKSSPLIFHLVVLFTADFCLNQLIHWGQKKKKKEWFSNCHSFNIY